ncbi:MAG: helix-turn-helix domain-containing protein [Enterococcaceae bacterium]|nr:helix-turn-helix domain-containing protein [Enterococcaceae bacterium]
MKNNLREFLQYKNVSQAELAELTGLSRPFINRLTNEKDGVDPQQSTMENIANALDSTVFDIFFNQNVQLVLQTKKANQK